MHKPTLFDKIFGPEADQCCESPRIVNIQGSKICEACGTVFDTPFVVQETSAYTAEEKAERQTHEVPWREFGPRTLINVSDLAVLTAERKARFRRLARIQGSLITSVERNLSEAKPLMRTFADRLNIPKHVLDTAWRIYTAVAQRQLTMGRSIQTFLGSALYVAIRIHNFPKLIDHIVDATNVPDKRLIKSIGLIIREILPTLGYKYTHNTDITSIIYIVGTSELHLSERAILRAIRLYKVSKLFKLQNIGHNPKGIAAAFLYIATRKKAKKPTQIEVADAARVTEVTVRTRIKELYEKIPTELISGIVDESILSLEEAVKPYLQKRLPSKVADLKQAIAANLKQKCPAVAEKTETISIIDYRKKSASGLKEKKRVISAN